MGSPAKPHLQKVLLIESGPRETGEKAVSELYRLGVEQLDVLTCYAGPPEAFDATRGESLSIHSDEAHGNRGLFISNLCARPYTSVVVMWVGSGVLRKWAVVIGGRTLRRLSIMDCDIELVPVRASAWRPLLLAAGKAINPLSNVDLQWGLSDSLLSRAVEVLLAPFQFGFLLAFTAWVHIRRFLRLSLRHMPHS